MVVKHRKKSSRLSGTHGWGRNKHRNSGGRGGYGMAGTGKKADHKKTQIWNKEYFGKHGFINKTATETKTITLKDLDEKILSKHEQGATIDLNKLGYDKLLGTGKITRKAKIIIAQAVPSAAEKIKAAGGELVNK